MMETALAIWQGLLINLGPPLMMALAYSSVKMLEQHGWKTTYAAALVRAVGEGQNAAAAKGVSLFSPAGRAEAIRAGTAYLTNTVATAAAGLGLTAADHETRIVAQIGAMEAAGQAVAQAATSRVPADTIAAVTGLGNLGTVPRG